MKAPRRRRRQRQRRLPQGQLRRASCAARAYAALACTLWAIRISGPAACIA